MDIVILLIQGDQKVAHLLQDALVSNREDICKVEWLRSCAAGVERLARKPGPGSASIAAVIVDLSLPDCHGIQVFDRVFKATPDIPILIICSELDELMARQAVELGAQDYLLKEKMDVSALPKLLHCMINRAANTRIIRAEKERAQITLDSIGDAVICTDIWGAVTYINAAAEKLLGWSRQAAFGHRIEEVFIIVDSVTREVVLSPMGMAVREDQAVGLTPNCLLIRRNGEEVAIEDSCAPIHDSSGKVTGAVMLFHDVTLARAQAMRMSYLAQHDGLTELPNRMLLNDRLTQAIAMAQRVHKQLAVLFLDLDTFKEVNDSHGHVVGDLLLQSVARRLLDCVRNTDTVCRLSGDEFVVLLPEISHAEDAGHLAAKILTELGKPYHITNHDIITTASIGVAVYPDDGIEAVTMIKNADFAMYHAKQSGGNAYRYFKSELNKHAIDQQLMEKSLRHAMDRHELVLYYQPIVNLVTGEVTGVEALIRWQHPKRGLIPPIQFIPIAEESETIVAIGQWVLREACRQARLWQNEGILPMLIAINVSAVELRDKNFVTGLQAILRETGMQPGNLVLEITETFMIQDVAHIEKVLQALSVLGVNLALDDFGTGFSSLSHLTQLPIHTIKIDRAFVRQIISDESAASVVSAVIAMSRSLHMRVVAEGVETIDQLNYLRKEGCMEGQGEYFYPAIPAEEITKLFQEYAGNARALA